VRPRDGVVDLATGRTSADGVVVLDVVRRERGYSLQVTSAGFGMQSRQLDAETRAEALDILTRIIAQAHETTKQTETTDE